MYRRGPSSFEIGRWDRRALRILFSSYYETHRVKVPRELARREFAFQPLEAESYVRHIYFSSEEDLFRYLVQEPPKHAYYSVGLYHLPEARSMEEKGWLGSEILVDIDVDKLEGCEGIKTEGGEIVGDECLERGFEMALVGRKILERDFGAEVSAYFSGSRGFHLIAREESYLRLGREEREEIARYLSARGLEIELLLPRRGRRMFPALPTERDPGWRGWLAQRARRPEDLELLGEKLGIPIDEQVTRDPSRLARLVGSINGKSGLLVTEIKDSFSPDITLSPWRGELTIKAKTSLEDVRVLGKELRMRSGETLSMDAAHAMLLYLKGAAEILEGEVEVV
ncbi:MAG: DNA primase small subunit domain-containing protein [Acidilobaceae archaeon]